MGEPPALMTMPVSDAGGALSLRPPETFLKSGERSTPMHLVIPVEQLPAAQRTAGREAASHPAATPSYRIGGFELQPGERRLLKAGEEVVLGLRAFAMLVALVERADQLVSKDDVLDLVWPGLVVEENNL